MIDFRPPSRAELEVIATLLCNNTDGRHLIRSLDTLLVAQMDDGGMGSLLLAPKDANPSRKFGRQLVLGQFLDTDGIPVSVSINVDQEGKLFELDIWKVDFSPLVQWPVPDSINVVSEAERADPENGTF